MFAIGGWLLASGGQFAEHDINQVWKSAAARSEVAMLRRQGKVKLLLARDVDVHYDNVQVLFGVNMEVDEGEIVALMGTNGAGKSTLLKAISGLVQASGGAVIFDGRDMTHTPARRDRRQAGRGRRPRRAGRVHPAQRGRQPAAGGLEPQGALARGEGRHRAGAGPVPDRCGTGWTSRPATCPAASSRC